MRIRQGCIVKVEDIGEPGRVIRVSDSGRAAVVEFDFPEGKVQSTLPVSLMSTVNPEGDTYAQT